eukprot:TRINITY_DN32913_c0_g1_i1.p1 TRINITY_DN32913_c0_g1~~TRINITY_DN32913_c0_g1_i1.p1  ORF type:complete len:386 (+),score=160.87 TRINITY_DN32913_c0_g1_i1:51-1160(+)
MAPKKAAERPVEDPEPAVEKAVGFDEPEFVSELLAKFASPGDSDAIVRSIAEAVEVAASDHRVNLRSSVLVDFWFGNLAFAQGRRWSGEKAQWFIMHMEELRQLVTSSPDGVAEAKMALRKALLQHEAQALAAQARPEPPADEAKEAAVDKDQPPVKPAPKAAGKPAKGAAPAPAQEAPPEPKRKPQPVVFSVDDLAGIAEHCQRGLFQHHRLYYRVFNVPRSGVEGAKVRVWVEEPAAPQRLAEADGPHEIGPSAPTRSKRCLEEQAEQEAKIAALREAEGQARAEEAERMRLIQQEHERRVREEEEERLNQLTLDDADQRQAVEAVRERVRGQLGARQEQLRQRLAALEDRLAHGDAEEAPAAPPKK